MITPPSVFKCICDGVIHKDEVCSHFNERCTMNGYPDDARCKFWAQIYTLQTAGNNDS